MPDPQFDTTSARRALSTLLVPHAHAEIGEPVGTDAGWTAPVTITSGGGVPAGIPDDGRPFLLGRYIKSRCAEVVAERHEQVAFWLNVAALAALATDAVLVCAIVGLREMKALGDTLTVAAVLAAGALFLAGGFLALAGFNRTSDAKTARKTADENRPVDVEPVLDYIGEPIADFNDLHRLPGEVADDQEAPVTGYRSGAEWSRAADRIGKPGPYPRRKPGPSGYPGGRLGSEFFDRLAADGVSDELIDTMRRADKVAADADAAIASMAQHVKVRPYTPDPAGDPNIIDAEATEVRPEPPVEERWGVNSFPPGGPETMHL